MGEIVPLGLYAPRYHTAPGVGQPSMDTAQPFESDYLMAGLENVRIKLHSIDDGSAPTIRRYNDTGGFPILTCR
jgi:hypothetical protein